MIFNPIVTGITSGIYFVTIINPNNIISILIYILIKVVKVCEIKY